MATQAAMIMDSIMGMKRVLAQQTEFSDSDESYMQPPNRGNKLKRKAQYTTDGRPARKVGRMTYTTNIEHAGYHRDILRRNPKRYDEDGDKLDSEDEDEEADARAAEENPYAEIHLDTLLAPLISAAQLADHPSLSAPYLSSTLADMAQHACHTMHREKKTLRNAKLLLRKFRGDEIRIPTKALNAAVDEEIFNVESVFNKIVAEGPMDKPNGSAMYSESVNGDIVSRTVSGSINGEGIHSVEAVAAQEKNLVKEAVDHLAPEDAEEEGADPAIETQDDVQMAGVDDKAAPPALLETAKDQDDETVEIVGLNSTHDQDRHRTNGTLSTIERPDIGEVTNDAPNIDVKSTSKVPTKPGLDPSATTDVDALRDETKSNNDGPEAMDEDKDSNQAPEPRRMRTRAQAAATSEPAVSSHTASPEPPYVPPPIHPLFLLPASSKPCTDYGLPPGEADETRRMLMVYVQKQEEVCRSAEKLYQNLLRANRERMAVLRWSKAEGHVGEMSDGEDWCDKEEWGLDEDLKKGEGDDKDGDDGNVGKKTRGRRA